MPLRRRAKGLGLALAFVLVAFLPAEVAPAGAAAETLEFDISISGIRAGEMTLSTDRTGETYTAGSRIRATGLIGAVARLRYDGTVTGRITGGGALEPARYIASSRSTRGERDIEIVYENGEAVSVRVDPPRARTPDAAARAGAIDPVTAGIALLRDNVPELICNRRVALFDGSRVSQVEIGRAEAQGAGYVCNGRYSRIDGEAHSVSDASDWPFRLIFRTNGTGLAVLHRIETRTRFGTAVIERRG